MKTVLLALSLLVVVSCADSTTYVVEGPAEPELTCAPPPPEGCYVVGKKKNHLTVACNSGTLVIEVRK